MQISGRRYDTGEAVTLTMEGEVISQITGSEAARGQWLAPGFVDLQVNGYRGQEFNDFELTTEKIGTINNAMDADGVTTYLPTATTHSFEMLAHTMRTLAAACEASADVGPHSRLSSRRALHLAARRTPRRPSARTLPSARLG